MIHKKVFLYSAVVLSMAGLGVGAGKSVANASETKASINYTAPKDMTYSLVGGEIKGYMRVKRSNGSLEYMVTHDFVDKNGSEAYCMDSEKPSPNGHTLALQGKLGDEFYRMYEVGYAKKGNLNGLPVANTEEARAATQYVSWILSNNYKKEDMVWSTPERSQEEIDRVHKAFDIIWDHVQNGKTSTDTTYDLKKVNETEDDIYYNYKFKSEANKTDGKASVSFDKEIPGMRILNKDGKEISKDNLPLDQEITIQIPKGTPTGELKITSEGDIKSVHVFKYGGDSAVQPANSLVSVDDEHKTDEQKINWKLKDIVIGTTATDKADNDKVLAPDTTATVVDEVSYQNLIVGKEYTVTGKVMDKETGKPLVIDGKEVTASGKFTAKTPNGKQDVEFTFNTAGLDGKKLVVFESMSTDNKEVATHADINDKGQTVEVDKKTPKIGTTATDKADKDKTLVTDQKVTVVDEVSYAGLIAGKEYTVTGTLMDKETGKPLMIDGKELTKSAKFTAKTANGKQDVEFTFNTAGLDDKELVVFENLYFGTKVIATHADINDKGQTVKVDKKTPKIGTTATDKADKDKTLANDQKVTVNDEVAYKGLVVGKEYTVTGKLMDKETGKALLVDGKEVTGTAKFVAKTPDGKVNVEFTFNTAGLENKELVAFESVKIGEKVIATHADLNDKGQTVKVNKPKTPLPQTGSENYQSKGLLGLALAGVSAFLVSAYSIIKRKNTAK
ncbi:TPA: VaFE repeat-containing surface-anchored protein [Enterococcus faecium]|uniref:VaFE repeat-containing surface-anchored protein n=1 Tax=Enterococcus sp. DIV1371a TaxID=2774870 RepID=UPI00376134CD|nr:VaFE repeat-containing surface-anchored protein [Enterococcus faecium]HCQ8930996.1 VaFE repeat-containing surface-anchored protein [Enterococcus faecium]